MNAFNIFRDYVQDIGRLSARWTDVWVESLPAFFCGLEDLSQFLLERKIRDCPEFLNTVPQCVTKHIRSFEHQSPSSHLDRICKPFGDAISKPSHLRGSPER
ncbi:hypothetical protein AVEN_212159-1 [Araneus ventricosus]|uniref:Uncharacterized protein n=1 Tax=Araneus ventricosus TaxID=182803 RepID=A0A4Y2LV88_ARAVE|nr:hypothetical protein AVEN_167855-1 [Araneus ventricosus]GBN17426.1 hypothetical protein AVEN_212159-1 [Araneus ventricosus]